ncbi:MAG: GNAT family N-acetyltransferase [Lachnospiraceae bacterium]|nr:GNAT family N-acetyltransferase [Lachnospiraceae bacterium]
MCGDREIVTNIREILPIWQACFGDSEEEIRQFLKILGEDVRTYVYREQGTAVSMVTLIPATLYGKGQVWKAAYLYAVGTLPAYRGKGYSSRLLGQIIRDLQAQEILPFLVPSKKDLVPFYERLGLSRRGTAYVFQGLALPCEASYIQGGYHDKASLKEISCEEYIGLRAKYVRQPGDCRLVDSGLRYALLLWQQEGGKIGVFTRKDRQIGVLYKQVGQELLLQEMISLGERMAVASEEELAGQMAGFLGAKKVQLHSCHLVMAACEETTDLPEKIFFRQALD